MTMTMEKRFLDLSGWCSNVWAESPEHDRPGQRPGYAFATVCRALKGWNGHIAPRDKRHSSGCGCAALSGLELVSGPRVPGRCPGLSCFGAFSAAMTRQAIHEPERRAPSRRVENNLEPGRDGARRSDRAFHGPNARHEAVEATHDKHRRNRKTMKDGDGVPKDSVKALDYLTKAAAGSPATKEALSKLTPSSANPVP